ncbi:MAG TPA: hypothetical protein VFP47_15275, partial [Pyrinomonadaceae bacterium]|nr:hypothetical protein [Pyrinomonadaceae bacterium]
MARRLLSVPLALSLLVCAIAQQPHPATPAVSPKPVTPPEVDGRKSDRVDRPTSVPYTGTLSIFEDPKRDER